MGRKLKGRHITGKGLKGALQSHIAKEEFDKKQKKSLEEERQKQVDKQKSIKSGGGKSKKHKVEQVKTFLPFEPSSTLLLVGEGDFSFACSLIREGYILGQNLIATGYDAREELEPKYPDVAKNLDYLLENGVKVIHSIDACNLLSSLKIKKSVSKQGTHLFESQKRLNYIMFNFPHTGRGMKDVDRNIRDHQKLVLSYFQNCKTLFEVVNKESNNDFTGYFGAEERYPQKIILSLFDGEPYVSWGVKALARSENYRVERSGVFNWLAFSGYHHKRTNSSRDTTKPASERSARIYLFDKSFPKQQQTQKDKESLASSDDE